jgi:hypothetical protein
MEEKIKCKAKPTTIALLRNGPPPLKRADILVVICLPLLVN